jgi:NO-binding membrane sensor protein with MHYT domain
MAKLVLYSSYHSSVRPSNQHCRVQLAACSVSFGLVAIWCMHFVGNRAIVLGDGEEAIQLYYNSTYTAVSAILPIIVVFLGFVVVDKFFKGSKSLVVRYTALAVCGICTGAAVTEMHYLGNNGTVNYRLIPQLGFIIGAAAIAIVACCVAFTLFFLWSSLWINTLWRRFLVSCVLAGAVSGMHWTAAAGTAYELRGYHSGSSAARNVNLIIAVCLVSQYVTSSRPLLTTFSVWAPAAYALWSVS